MLNIAQYEDLTVLRLQRRQRFAERFAEFLSLESLDRDFPPVGKIFGPVIALLICSGLFGIRVVVQHRPCRKEHRSLVRADQTVEGFLIALSHSADQFLVRHIDLRLRYRCHACLMAARAEPADSRVTIYDNPGATTSSPRDRIAPGCNAIIPRDFVVRGGLLSHSPYQDPPKSR